VRRLLDIVACTTVFGAKKPDAADAAAESAKAGSPSPGKTAPGGGEEPMYPPPKLEQFYDFFTFSHLTPPLHCECSRQLPLFRILISLMRGFFFFLLIQN
jgi:protein TIF31